MTHQEIYSLHRVRPLVAIALASLMLASCQRTASNATHSERQNAGPPAASESPGPVATKSTTTSASQQDRRARIALARLRCETAARGVVDALKRVEADVERHATEWRNIQQQLPQLSIYLPGSGMKMPEAKDIDFPEHGKHIRAAANHFELELTRSILDVKEAWIRFGRETRGLSTIDREASPPEQESLENPVAALRSETTLKATHICMNLDAYLQAVNEKYRASLRVR